jgi:thymidylate kinase
MDLDRLNSYDKEHCWQYDIRLNNKIEDLERYNLTEEQVSKLRVSDFDLEFEDKKIVWDEVKQFIERHEWLGKMGLYPTHIFTARYKGILAGVLSFDMPNAFSKMLGEETKTMERLIGRGACISWSPKNLASSMIGKAIKELVKTTSYRLFTAYSDVEAREIGTIYQACNFYYLGQKSGSGYQYKIRDNKWVSDRYFRSRSVYKKIAKNDGIEWEKEWQKGDKVFFDLMPTEIELRMRKLSKEYQKSCEKRKLVPKHKYAYVLGANKRETKKLRKLFGERNKTYQYPKERGLF